MKFVAITGSIGCGKTTIAKILRKQGFFVFDADKLVKHIYYNKFFLQKVKTYFPEVFEKNVFYKKRLRDVVFSDSKKLNILEGLIYPYLTKKIKKIVKYRKNKGLVFMDVALLYEKGWDKYFDFVILADVDKKTQKIRVMQRDGISAEDFEKIDKIQLDMNIKRQKADFIIETGVTLNKLRKNVIDVVEFLKKYE